MKVIERSLELNPEYDLRSICSPEEMLLFDIETTGLKKETTQLYLIGCAFFADNVWHSRQWLTENASDESAVLEDFLAFAEGFRVLVHFNGEGFDIPYIQYKTQYYMTDTDLSRHRSFDIYKRARTARRLLAMKSMSQKSIEQFLGIDREDQLNGGLLIPVYYDYEKTGAGELERLLLLHNYDDLQGMMKILPILAYADVMDGTFSFAGIQESRGSISLNYHLAAPVPVPCSALTGTKEREDTEILLERDLLRINIRLYENTGRIPLENISDYYYLPEEDQVIHKDVAQFVDRSRRVKATKKNCFLKKQGRFLPQPGSAFAPAFWLEGDIKRTYIDVEELLSCTDRTAFLRLAFDILHSITSC